MGSRIDHLLQRLDLPVIRLEYTTEELDASPGCRPAPYGLEISDRGMAFSSCWRFEAGTEMFVSWERERTVQMAVGVVVFSERNSLNCFKTTLFFVDKNQPAGHDVRRV